MTARIAVRVTGLRKAFGEKVVLDGIDLEIAEGNVDPAVSALHQQCLRADGLNPRRSALVR
jgi:hypothetical protein